MGGKFSSVVDVARRNYVVLTSSLERIELKYSYFYYTEEGGIPRFFRRRNGKLEEYNSRGGNWVSSHNVEHLMPFDREPYVAELYGEPVLCLNIPTSTGSGSLLCLALNIGGASSRLTDHPLKEYLVSRRSWQRLYWENPSELTEPEDTY